MPYPLHPAVVHFPIVLAVLLPFIAAAGFLVARGSERPRTPWIAVVVFAVLLPLSAWVSLYTGQQQEDVVEAVVSEGYIHGHEEAAEGFLAGSAVLAVIVLAGLLPGAAGRGARMVSIPAALVVLALVYRVGASGGELVYAHGAASAYVDPTPGAAAPDARQFPRGDDDEGREGGQH